MRSRIHNSSVSTSEITSRGRRGVYSCVRFAAGERAACALHEVHRPHHTTDNTTTKPGQIDVDDRVWRLLGFAPPDKNSGSHISDLGGEDNVSEAERALLRRAVTLIIELERREVMFAQAGAADDEALAIIVHPRSGG